MNELLLRILVTGVIYLSVFINADSSPKWSWSTFSYSLIGSTEKKDCLTGICIDKFECVSSLVINVSLEACPPLNGQSRVCCSVNKSLEKPVVTESIFLEEFFHNTSMPNKILTIEENLKDINFFNEEPTINNDTSDNLFNYTSAYVNDSDKHEFSAIEYKLLSNKTSDKIVTNSHSRNHHHGHENVQKQIPSGNEALSTESSRRELVESAAFRDRNRGYSDGFSDYWPEYNYDSRNKEFSRNKPHNTHFWSKSTVYNLRKPTKTSPYSPRTKSTFHTKTETTHPWRKSTRTSGSTSSKANNRITIPPKKPTKPSWIEDNNNNNRNSPSFTRTKNFDKTTKSLNKQSVSQHFGKTTPYHKTSALPSVRSTKTYWSQKPTTTSRWKTTQTLKSHTNVHKPSKPTSRTSGTKKPTTNVNRHSTRKETSRKTTLSTKGILPRTPSAHSTRNKDAPLEKQSTRENYKTTTPLPNINIQFCGVRETDTENDPTEATSNTDNVGGAVFYPEYNRRKRRNSRESFQRIVGGKEAEPFSWPWVAALYKISSSGGNRFLCAGSLINQYFVLTAAHVFTPDDLRSSTYMVMLGTHTGKEAVAEYAVVNILQHPRYEQRYYYNDIALLRLERPVAFHDLVMPVCLPSPVMPFFRDSDLVGKRVTVMGWGDDAFGGVTSRVLREASFPIVSRTSCNDSYFKVVSNRLPKGITHEMICAGSPSGGKDACQGDSGGPLTVIEKGRYTQVGIVSFGYKCGDKNYPGVYTKVSPYLSWIADNSRCDDIDYNYYYPRYT